MNAYVATIKKTIFISIFFSTFNCLREEPINNENVDGYVATNESISGFFGALSSVINKPVILSKLAARKKLSGDISLSEPLLQLESVCNRLGLIWYSNESTIYVYDASEMHSRIITLKNISFDFFTRYLRKIGLLDKRYPLRGEASSRTFFISGPPGYIESIDQLALTLDEQDISRRDVDSVSIFYLSNTFAEDRIYSYRDERIIVPGIASVLTKLFTGITPVKTSIVLPKNTTPGMRLPSPGVPTANADEQKESVPEKNIVFNGTSSMQIISNPGNNSLLIKGSEQQIKHAQNLIAALDKPRRHIELSVWIVDLKRSTLDQLGANWSGNFTLGKQLGFSLNAGWDGSAAANNISSTLDGGQFVAKIIALSQKNLANIISRPVILTQENIPAVFDASHSIYTRLLGEHNVELQKITYGTSVSVLPRFTQDNEIEMMLNVEDGNANGTQGGSESATSSLPVVGQTNISTVARVPRGKSLLIGGYTRDEDQNDNAKIPLLGDIPFIGALFRYRIAHNNQTVRVFLIQPKEILSANITDSNTVSNEMLTSTPLRDWKQNLALSLF